MMTMKTRIRVVCATLVGAALFAPISVQADPSQLYTPADGSPADVAGDELAAAGDSCAEPNSVTGFGQVATAVSARTSQYAGSCGGGSGNEYVFAWQAPATGQACFDTTGSTRDTVLYVRSMCADPNWELACVDDTANSLQAALTIPVRQGEFYYVFIDTYGGVSPFQANLTVTQGPCGQSAQPPSGGASCPLPYAHRLSGEGVVRGRTSGASQLTPGCLQSGGIGPEEVTQFTAPRSGTWCATTRGSAHPDTVVYVRERCGDPSSEIACNDDFGTLASAASFYATQGRSYDIVVDGYGTSSAGDYQLIVLPGDCAQVLVERSCGDGQDNDLDEMIDCVDPDCQSSPACTGQSASGSGATMCDSPQPLPAGQVVRGTTPSAASAHAGTCGGSSSPEHAYAFSANANGMVCIDSTGSSFDTILHVRENACWDMNAEVACNDDAAGSLQSQVTVPIRAGQTYYVFVDGYGGASGEYALQMTEGPCGQSSQSTAPDCSSVRLSNFAWPSGGRYFCEDPASFSLDASQATEVEISIGRPGQRGATTMRAQLGAGNNTITLHRNPSELDVTIQGEITITPVCSSGGRLSTGTPLRSSSRIVYGRRVCEENSREAGGEVEPSETELDTLIED